METKRRYKEIDLLRGIAIILVILGHAIIVYPINLHETGWCSVLFTWVCSVHMPLFFLISGFCYSFRWGQDSFGSEYRKYLWKKTKRLLIPYLVFCGISIVMKILFPALVNNKASFADDVMDIFLRGGGYWFLYTLFFIFLIFPVLEIIYKRCFLLFVVLNAYFLFLWMCDALPVKTDIFTLKDICHYLSYFSAGFIIKKDLDKVKKSYEKVQKPVYIAIGAALWIGCIVTIKVYPAGNRLMNFVSSLIGIYCLVYLVSAIKEYRCTLLSSCSKYSLQLYLMNGYMLVISRTISVKFLCWSNAAIIIAFNMLIDLFLSLLIIKYIIDSNKLTRFLAGIV